jgi:outer membrane murein-binding lipoprotein Lpp
MAIAAMKNQSGGKMWPFGGISLDAATVLFSVADWGLLGSLLVGVISTFAIVRLGNVKEAYWDASREASDERIAGLNRETAKLSAAAEASRAAIAVANAEAAKANQIAENEHVERLKLELKLAPRALGPERTRQLASRLGSLARIDVDLVVYEYLGQDVSGLAQEITAAMDAAHEG